MATGNMHGDIALWDLTNRRLVHNMKAAHSALITSLTFLDSQPVLVSAGVDNAVKVNINIYIYIYVYEKRKNLHNT